jgi:hypothetical protein
MPGNATPLIEALLEVIDAAWLYLLGEIHKDVFVTRSSRRSTIRGIAALAAHGYPVTAVE